MRPRAGFGQSSAGLAWMDARFVAVPVVGAAQGSGHVIENRADIDK